MLSEAAAELVCNCSFLIDLTFSSGSSSITAGLVCSLEVSTFLPPLLLLESPIEVLESRVEEFEISCNTPRVLPGLRQVCRCLLSSFGLMNLTSQGLHMYGESIM